MLSRLETETCQLATYISDITKQKKNAHHTRLNVLISYPYFIFRHFVPMALFYETKISDRIFYSHVWSFLATIQLFAIFFCLYCTLVSEPAYFFLYYKAKTKSHRSIAWNGECILAPKTFFSSSHHFVTAIRNILLLYYGWHREIWATHSYSQNV